MNADPKSRALHEWQGSTTLQVRGSVHRGFHQFYPKKADIAKVLASMIWPEYFYSYDQSPEINVFTTDELPLIDHLSQILRMPTSYHILQDKIDSVLHALVNLNVPSIMAFTGSWRINENQTDRFSKILHGLRPQYQGDLLSMLCDHPEKIIPLNSPAKVISPLLAQEKPGRLFYYDLEKDSLEFALKRWKQARLRASDPSFKSGGFYPSDSGWAVGAAYFNKAENISRERRVKLTAKKMHLTESTHFMERGEKLGELIKNFIPNFLTKADGRIFLGFKDFCSTGQLYHWLKGQKQTDWWRNSWEIMVPDGLGWHPAATLWEMLTEEEVPCVYILVEELPEVWLIATEVDFLR